MAFENFPYTDFHNLNLDWLIKSMDDCLKKVKDLDLSFDELHDYVMNYFKNLDVTAEVREIIDELVANGTMANIINQQIFAELNHKIAVNASKRTIVVGDSYSTAGPWSTEFSWVDILKETGNNQDIINMSQGGIGFCTNPSFEDKINEYIAQGHDNTLVKNIVVAGSFNDRTADEPTLSENIKRFKNIVTANFPNATLYLAPMGNAINHLCGVENSTQSRLMEVNRRYMRWGQFYGYVLIPAYRAMCNDPSYFASDYMHPNGTGMYQLAFIVGQGLQGGIDQYTTDTPGITVWHPDSYVQSFSWPNTIRATDDNYTLLADLFNVVFKTPQSLKRDGAPLHIGTFSHPAIFGGNGIYVCFVSGEAFTTDNEWVNLKGYIHIYGDSEIAIRCWDVDPLDYKQPISVTKIQLHGVNVPYNIVKCIGG